MSNDFYNVSADITPSDTVNLPNCPPFDGLMDAIYVGGAGIVVAVKEDNTTTQFTAVAGEIIPIRLRRVNSTTTSATLMRALKQV